jgi:ferredoxin-type protein NapF
MGIDPSRRRLLTLAAAEPARPGITIGPACFAARGIVCQSCGDHCIAGAIRFRPRLGAAPELLLDDQRCTACGDCVAICPAGAIQVRTARG